MSTGRRLSNEELRKALKRDEFGESLHRALDWSKSHLENVIIGAVIAAVMGFGAYYWTSSRADAASRASLQLSSAEQQLQRSLGGLAAELGQASAAFQSVKVEFEGRAEAGIAELGAAHADFEAGKFTEAQGAYERFLATRGDSHLAPVASLSLAASLEAQGKAKEAADAYSTAAGKYPGSPAAGPALFEAARCLQALGDKGRLKPTLDRLVAMEREGRLADSLKSRLALLKARAL